MNAPEPSSADQNLQIYAAREHVELLRRKAYDMPAASEDVWAELLKAEQGLEALSGTLLAEEAQVRGTGLIVDTEDVSHHLGAGTTGLEVKVQLRMTYVPTSIAHLLDPTGTPLLSCYVRNAFENSAASAVRVRVTAYIDGYSAQAVETVELENYNDTHEFDLLPTLFPERVKGLDEMTRATLNILVEDLDGKPELQQTHLIWLLARTTLPLKYWDPKTGKMVDTAHYLGAFVTPNDPEVHALLAAATALHPAWRLNGYQVGEGEAQAAVVTAQVRALYDALAARETRYVHSGVSFGPDQEAVNHQRVRLPRESLQLKLANCFDGAVLFASLLEAIGMSAAVVLVPGHAFVGWETWRWYDDQTKSYQSSNEWAYLETTLVGQAPFDQARGSAEVAYRRQGPRARRLELRELRARGITPMA